MDGVHWVLPGRRTEECKILKEVFLKWKYPEKLLDSTINRFSHSQDQNKTPCAVPANNPVRIILLFKHQKSADVVCKELRDLGLKVNQELQPVFTSKNILGDLKITEINPLLSTGNASPFMNSKVI